MKAGFEGDAFMYVLMLRLIPLPFFLVNLASAVLNVRLRSFAGGTAIGIIPARLAYAVIGAGAGERVASGESLTVQRLAEPKIDVGLALLAALTRAGLWLKRRREVAG